MLSLDETVHSKIIYEFELSTGFSLCITKSRTRNIHITEGPKAINMTNDDIQKTLLHNIEEKWDEFINLNRDQYNKIRDIPKTLTKRLIVLFLIFIIPLIALGIFWYTYLSKHTELIRSSVCIAMGIIMIDSIFAIILLSRTMINHSKHKKEWLKLLKYELGLYIDEILNVQFSNINPNYLLTIHEKKYKLYILLTDDIVDLPKMSLSSRGSSLNDLQIPMDTNHAMHIPLLAD